MVAEVRKGPREMGRSGGGLGDTSPVTRTVSGASKRVRRVTGRPLSIRNDRSMKSLPISRLDRVGVITRLPAKERIGGKLSCRPIVRVGNVGPPNDDCGTGVQAVKNMTEIAIRRRKVVFTSLPDQADQRARKGRCQTGQRNLRRPSKRSVHRSTSVVSAH